MSGLRQTALTEAEQERIVALAAVQADGSRANCYRVAAAIDRPVNMVRWFMYRQGLSQPLRYRRPTSYQRRGGITVRFFSAEEDTLILAMRADGARLIDIAAALHAATGHKRRPRAIKVRLVMLAGFEAEAEERAEAAEAARQPLRRAA